MTRCDLHHTSGWPGPRWLIEIQAIDKATGRPKSCTMLNWKSMEQRRCRSRLTFRPRGPSFGPEAMASMANAFEEAIAVIGIGPQDETKREAVARFILHLAEIDGGLDSAILRDKGVSALGSSIHAVISND